MATTIEAGTAQAYAPAKGVLILTPGDRKPYLDITFNCNSRDRYGNPYQGVAFSYALAYGSTPSIDFSTTAIACGEASASLILGNVFPAEVTAYAFAYGNILLEHFRSNWVKWSNIGNLDFTIDKTNVAGERPLDWKGWIYSVRKLGNRVVAYGENGVSVLAPAQKHYSLNTVYRIGLKGKNAVSGDESVHYFVDNLGQLWRFSEGLEKLDYSEYLSGMLSKLVLSWDAANNLLYICDGIRGYVFSQDSGSLGTGPVNITGINSQGGILYVVSPATITVPIFEICSDIMDLGTRRGKRIHSLEIGVDLAGSLQAAIDYRLDKAAEFVTTPWQVVDRRGFVYLPCYGKEFRIRIKMDSYEYAELDYITVNGEVCNH